MRGIKGGIRGKVRGGISGRGSRGIRGGIQGWGFGMRSGHARRIVIGPERPARGPASAQRSKVSLERLVARGGFQRVVCSILKKFHESLISSRPRFARELRRRESRVKTGTTLLLRRGQLCFSETQRSRRVVRGTDTSRRIRFETQDRDARDGNPTARISEPKRSDVGAPTSGC